MFELHDESTIIIILQIHRSIDQYVLQATGLDA